MRVIKFRVWDSRFSKFLKLDGSVLMHPESGSLHGSRSSGNVDSWVLQQFTGLHDKNGVEIYEGDICVWYINDFERVGEIYYHSQSFEMRSPSMGYIGWDANRGEIEVIGNIHETPELLK